jgi:hypothetical protein
VLCRWKNIEISKNKLVNQKQLLKEKLSAFEQKANNRFELTEKFSEANIQWWNWQTRKQMKKIFICSKKSVRTFKLRIEPYFLSHAERGESFQIQDFVGGMQNRRRFAPTIFSASETLFRKFAEAGRFELPMPCDMLPFSDIKQSRGYGIRTREGFHLATFPR